MIGQKLMRFFEWAKRETQSIIPAIIYFLISFNLVYYTVGLRMGPHEHRYVTPFMVNIAALIMGKVLLIANALPFINAFPHRPLIFNTVWKLLIYIFFACLIWIIEAMRHLDRELHSMDQVWQQILFDVTTRTFTSTILWLTYIFAIYIVFSEFTGLIGRGRVLKILFRSPPSKVSSKA